MSRRKHKSPTATHAVPTPDHPIAASTRTDVYDDSLPIRRRHAGGVDLGPRSHWVAAPPRADGAPQTAEFDTYNLEAPADWPRQHGVTTVALEATGVYWGPLFAILQERGFDVIPTAPTYTSGIKGRPKTDRLDCQWIQRPHAHGPLPASFRPSADVAVPRHYPRQRAELVHNGARHIRHVRKALEQMNVKPPEVLSDITGLTGRKIIQAILAGQRDPPTLARPRDEHRHNNADVIARALRGSWRPEAAFALQQAWDSWQHYQQQMRAVEEVIHPQLQRMKKSPERRRCPPSLGNGAVKLTTLVSTFAPPRTTSPAST